MAFEIVWINLDHRTDRKAQMEQELQSLGWLDRALRFSAVAESPGFVGASVSHLEVLRTVMDWGAPAVLVLEDDFEPLVPPEDFKLRLEEATREDFDVLLLSHHLLFYRPHSELLHRAFQSHDASAYLVAGHYLPTLVRLWELALPRLRATHEHWLYSNDASWCCLQPLHKWLAFDPPLSHQRASFSDNSLEVSGSALQQANLERAGHQRASLLSPEEAENLRTQALAHPPAGLLD